MKLLIYLLLILFLFTECVQDTPRKTISKQKIDTLNKPISQKKKSPKKNKNQYSKLINNQNVKKRLGDYARKNKSNKVKITTKFGDITVKLYDDTPLHRANFIMLANRGFFDSTLFYRVIRNFMIQGGNSDKGNMLQKMANIGHYRIPPEIRENHIHKRGALAMAVQEQYYIDPSKHDPSSIHIISTLFKTVLFQINIWKVRRSTINIPEKVKNLPIYGQPSSR